jgi:hypothetical protein
MSCVRCTVPLYLVLVPGGYPCVYTHELYIIILLTSLIIRDITTKFSTTRFLGVAAVRVLLLLLPLLLPRTVQ